ncbi:MAG: endonuclease MutS2, partial [Bacteroidales bacterium]|nr:endonuclease MutS2 [Bacteroidales bacterium]
MFYPDNFETKLGFDKIRAMLKGAVLCPLGSARIDQMKFMTKRSDIEYELALVKEMIEILQESKTPMPTDGFFDLTEQLKRLRLNGTFLEAEDLFSLRRSLGAIIDLVKFFNPKEEEGRKTFPLMKAITADVIVFPDLCRKIDRTLTPTGEIQDNASPVLADIRHQLASTVSSISRLLNNILRSAQSNGIVDKDVTPTLRDGRLVIPILPSNKRKIRGIVHDESATGKTLYVEPAEVVEANNRIRELEGEERQEIIRILTAIANEIRPMLPDIMASFDFMGTVDFVRAKAKFAERIEATVPQMSSDGSLDWIHAKHPLLYIRYKSEGKASEIVPLDIMLDRRNQRIVLISGPNAGGKSVCLETLGLVQYMLQCGIAIPVAANSLCTIFDNIFIDIGDEQSIDNDLSTYSSHLQNMKFFVRNATKRTLILIDEFGSGTEPQIGGAIAQALLGKFNEAKVNGVITTHFTNLKHFAEETPGIVNGAMLYDRNGLRPLFKLEIGHPGSSFAIEIAHKIGLPQDVIEAAKEIVGSDYVNMDKYLQDISRDKRYWEQKRQKIHQQEKDLEEKMAKVDEKASELKSKRQEVLQKARDEASALLKEANARIERTIKD